jgi:hypothetical protein
MEVQVRPEHFRMPRECEGQHRRMQEQYPASLSSAHGNRIAFVWEWLV